MNTIITAIRMSIFNFLLNLDLAGVQDWKKTCICMHGQEVDDKIFKNLMKEIKAIFGEEEFGRFIKYTCSRGRKLQPNQFDPKDETYMPMCFQTKHFIKVLNEFVEALPID